MIDQTQELSEQVREQVAQRVLSQTESVCPDCLQKIPAYRVSEGELVFLEKTCPEHGVFRTKIWEGGPSFESWIRPKIPGVIRVPLTEVRHGCPFDCGLCSDHRQHTCTAVIEVTQRCNLHCTFCFADAGGKSVDPDQARIKTWYQRLLDTGGPCNVQISGGEPTLRTDLPEIIAMGHSMGFGFIQLNTNGLRLSRDRKLLNALKQAGLSSVFLQFDGTEPEIYQKLRGRDFLQDKLRVISMCGELGIGVVLVPTLVAGVNDHNLGSIIDFALENMPYVRGVHFQPASYFGRIPTSPSNDTRITLPEVMTRIEQQTNGRIKAANFRPPGCENALCSFHGNFILMPDRTLTATTRHEPALACCAPTERAEEGAQKAKEFVSNRWAAVEQEASESLCGCESGCDSSQSSPPLIQLDSIDQFLNRAKTHTLAVSAMAFQDAWNLDLERLRDCCIHTVAPDGNLIPFCAYNLTDSNGRYLYRGRTAPVCP